MCGIAGMVGPGASRDVVAAMTDAQRHRGPDGEGLWCAPGVALGHRRLKIIDLSEAGRQPMTTADGRYTIVFNGEVYNYEEIRASIADCELRIANCGLRNSQSRIRNRERTPTRGVPTFRSRTDTEVILYAYARWGAACLERFVGMYGLAIWDARERELFCARDRLGIKPFYYALSGRATTQGRPYFLFASEIRGLLAAGVPAAVNEGVLYDFLARDFYEINDETFFKRIYKLPPGHWMVVKEGHPQPARRYWNLKTEADEIADCGLRIADLPESIRNREREERLLDLAAEAVRSHLVSDVPVGIALSGGLDSATLLTLLDRAHPDPTKVEAFSFTFAEADYSERAYVEEMARHTGRRAHFVEMSARTFAETAERFSASQEEPFAGAPISAYSLCYERARAEGFIVLMDGSGVDEGLAGYGRFRPALWADLFAAGDWAALEAELAASGVRTPAQREAALDQMYQAARPESDVGKGQDLTSSVRPDCLHPDFVAAARTPMPTFERPFGDNLRNLMYRELRYTKLPRALRFRDRLSMAVGTELRPPFLDHRLLAYEFALPAEDHIHQGVSKAILRRAAARLLPDAVRLASKRSVQTPQREWFRGELKEWVRERIDTPSFWQRGWVDRKSALAAMEAFFRGEGDNSFFLWQWINLEMWAQEYLKSDE